MMKYLFHLKLFIYALIIVLIKTDGYINIKDQ